MIVPFKLREGYWEEFELKEEDVEFLYNHLLELETPLTSNELVAALVDERIRIAKDEFENSHVAGGDVYLPKREYALNQELVFPAFSWQHGRVISTRPGQNPEIGDFQVIGVEFETGEVRELAANLSEHALNEPPKIDLENPSLIPARVLEQYGEDLAMTLEDALASRQGFTRIAGRWFPRALLIDINIGHLNLAEAVLDMVGGGPVSTHELIEQIGFKSELNPNLVEFSFDLALEEDTRFDEVGPAGKTLWYLNRLEPPQVLEAPIYLRYSGIEYDREKLTPAMLELERSLEDELSPIAGRFSQLQEVEVRLIFPHLRSGTLPLSARVKHIFPTAHEAPRVRFFFVDGQTGEKFPGWVVREKRYIYGLSDWYRSHGLMPGSIVRVGRGKNPGEIMIRTETRKPTRDWMRTVLVGSDGGIVFAMLKQPASGPYDDRMAIAIPDISALDQVWSRPGREQPGFERVVVNTVREMARLNTQSHVHASELYAAVNIVRRCPPGPILAMLATNPSFVHVGDLHFRFTEAEGN